MNMVTWQEISNVCARLAFPKPAVAHLEICYEKINKHAAAQLQNVAADWLNPGRTGENV